MFTVEADGQFGQTDDANTVALTPVNANGVFPEPFEDDSAATSMMHTPFLAEKLGVFFGKLVALNGDAINFAYSKGNEQFMNLAFGINPVVRALAIRWGQPRAQIA